MASGSNSETGPTSKPCSSHRSCAYPVRLLPRSSGGSAIAASRYAELPEDLSYEDMLFVKQLRAAQIVELDSAEAAVLQRGSACSGDRRQARRRAHAGSPGGAG